VVVVVGLVVDVVVLDVVVVGLVVDVVVVFVGGGTVESFGSAGPPGSRITPFARPSSSPIAPSRKWST
jgi:hypothetical protein